MDQPRSETVYEKDFYNTSSEWESLFSSTNESAYIHLSTITLKYI